eukprot:6209434-Pleurochrysis_carterae.AAC.2
MTCASPNAHGAQGMSRNMRIVVCTSRRCSLAQNFANRCDKPDMVACVEAAQAQCTVPMITVQSLIGAIGLLLFSFDNYQYLLDASSCWAAEITKA